MSYNLKNKSIVMIVCVLAVMMTISHVSFAEETQVSPEVASPTDVKTEEVKTDEVKTDEEKAKSVEESNKKVENQASDSTDILAVNKDDAENKENSISDKDLKGSDDLVDNELDLSFASGDSNPIFDDFQSSPEIDSVEDVNSDVNPTKTGSSDGNETDALASGDTNEADISSAIQESEAPKSPFESFGNAILSKVDNDLFNQMSNIEKHNTLLNLELKREELKNKVAALRAQRQKAKDEEEARKRAEEEKLKDLEAARQAKILIEEQKLREKEIELEKVRQAKVLNEYMNEMLLMNQKWIEKNNELLGQIRDLKNDRIEMIKGFEDQISQVQHSVVSLKKKAEVALSEHDRVVLSLNSQINQLKKTISENEDRIKRLQSSEGTSSANPFATAVDSVTGMDGSAIDMSYEYAIMDITGKGDDIVAKIVNKDGTAFSIHKGSVMKGGEIVTDITDHYVAFENNGVKSFIYTGGTVLEFEPTTAFNDSDKLAESATIPANATTRPVVQNTSLLKSNNDKKLQQQPSRQNKNNQVKTDTNKNTAKSSSRPVSIGSGMFVQ